MEEFSDSTNATFILIIMFFFYMFLRFRRTELKIRQNLGNVNCNPLEMVIGSMVNEEEANKSFSACMEYSTAKNITESQQKKKDEFTQEIAYLKNQIEKSVNDENVNNRDKRAALFKALNSKTETVGDLVSQQRMINDTISDSSVPIQNIAQRIGDITSKIKEIFIKINDDE